MKKSKILFLLPFAGLLLSGCSFNEVLAKVGISIGNKQEEKPEKEDNDNGGNQQGQNQQGEGENGGNHNGGNGGNGENGGNQQQAGDPVTFDFSVIQTTSGQEGGYSFTTAVGTNSSNQAPQWNERSLELRLYIGNTLTITGSGAMTSIVFDANTCGESKADGTLSASKGSLNAFSWSGSETEVTFTVDSGKQVHINKIDINGGAEGGGTTIDVLDEFPLEQVQAAISGGTSETFPIPEGESFEFKLDNDPDYPYSCYVTVHGGNYGEYIQALTLANFGIDDSYADQGAYYAFSECETLAIGISFESLSEYVLNFYTLVPLAKSDTFPKDAVDEYLASINISVEYPIPEGTLFKYEYDEEYETYDVYVYGGSSTTYMTALEEAGFNKDDEYLADYYEVYFDKGDLEIDIYAYDLVDEGYYIVSFCEYESL